MDDHTDQPLVNDLRRLVGLVTSNSKRQERQQDYQEDKLEESAAVGTDLVVQRRRGHLPGSCWGSKRRRDFCVGLLYRRGGRRHNGAVTRRTSYLLPRRSIFHLQLNLTMRTAEFHVGREGFKARLSMSLKECHILEGTNEDWLGIE